MMAKGKGKKKKFSKNMPMQMMDSEGMKNMHKNSGMAEDHGGVLNRKKSVNTHGMRYLKG